MTKTCVEEEEQARQFDEDDFEGAFAVEKMFHAISKTRKASNPAGSFWTANQLLKFSVI
jgi:hypothetical protein